MFKLNLALVFILFGNVAVAKSVPAIFSWGGEAFYKIADLPDTPQYKFNDHFVDIGVKYTEFQIFFLPIWQSDMEYIGIIPYNSDQYYEFSNDEIMELASSAHISIPPISQVSLDFWTAWGGKLVLVLILLLLVMYSVISSKNEDSQH